MFRIMLRSKIHECIEITVFHSQKMDIAFDWINNVYIMNLGVDALFSWDDYYITKIN